MNILDTLLKYNIVQRDKYNTNLIMLGFNFIYKKKIILR